MTNTKVLGITICLTNIVTSKKVNFYSRQLMNVTFYKTEFALPLYGDAMNFMKEKLLA